MKKKIGKIIKLIESAKTIDDGKIGFALISLYKLRDEFANQEIDRE